MNYSGDDETISSLNNEDGELNNCRKDNIFLSLCLKGGLTPEQIYSILQQQEETKQQLSNEKLLVTQEETKRKELDLEIVKLEQNKRKFQGYDDEFEKNKKIKNSTLNLCDEMILQILQFLNDNFNAFKLITISKQFYRVVKLLTNFTFKTVPHVNEPPTIISFVNSMFFHQIEKLQFHFYAEINTVNSILKNCVNLKHAEVILLDCESNKNKLDFSGFKNRNISKIEHLDLKIDKSKKNFQLDLRNHNFYNLTTLNICGFKDLGLSNVTSNIQNLKIGHFSSSLEENLLTKLPKLKSLECFLTRVNSSIPLFKINSIEKLIITIYDFSKEIPDIDFHSMKCPNLKYLNIKEHHGGLISKISGGYFPKLEYLKLSFLIFDGELELSNNSSLSNLKTLKLSGSSDNSIKSIFESKYLQNVTNLKLQSVAESSDILLYFTKSELFQNLKQFSGFSKGSSINGYKEFFESSKLKSLKKLTIDKPNDINNLIYLANCKTLTNLEYLNVPHCFDSPDNFFKTFCENEFSFQKLKNLLIFVKRDEDVLTIINSHLKRAQFPMSTSNFNADTCKLLAQNNKI